MDIDENLNYIGIPKRYHEILMFLKSVKRPMIFHILFYPFLFTVYIPYVDMH